MADYISFPFFDKALVPLDIAIEFQILKIVDMSHIQCIYHTFSPKMSLEKNSIETETDCFFSPCFAIFCKGYPDIPNEVRKGWYGLSNLTCTDHGEASGFDDSLSLSAGISDR